MRCPCGSFAERLSWERSLVISWGMCCLDIDEEGDHVLTRHRPFGGVHCRRVYSPGHFLPSGISIAQAGMGGRVIAGGGVLRVNSGSGPLVACRVRAEAGA